MIIGTPVDSSIHLAHHQQRQREIDAASHRLSSGSKVERIEKDTGAFHFTARLDGQIRTDQAAANNLRNAITFVQTKSDGLRSVERVLFRMDELALRSSDVGLTSRDRLRYQSEFSSLQTHLGQLVTEKFNDDPLYDPQAAKYADVYPVAGVSDGGWKKQEKKVDIGALSGGIRLWWNSQWQTDRLKIYQGNSLLFDSGEHRTQHWVNFAQRGIEDPVVKGSYDEYQIDFEPGSVKVEPTSGNKGISLHDKDGFKDYIDNTSKAERAWFANNFLLPVTSHDMHFIDRTIKSYFDSVYTTSEDFPRSEIPTGDSTEIRFVVNEDPGGYPFVRDPLSDTAWAYDAEITKGNLPTKKVLAAADGSTIELQNIGFSTLSELSIDTLAGALNALGVIKLEQENIRYQQGVIGSEISRFRTQAETLERKSVIESRAVARIVDADFAEETTRLAKNLLMSDTSSALLVQARVNAAQVYQSLL